MRTLINLLVWLTLCALAGLAAWQFHATLLAVTAAWLQSDLPRPLGWATWTLAPISRASILLLGSGWLIGVLWMERDLGRYAYPRAFWLRAGKLAAGLGGVVVVCWAVVRLVSA
ncbi:MAG: hypothetical protein KJZ86_24670 [Caldilineaceae bacterium]|nr:hypothetical protein [Caldilineaceae bacterium]